MPREPEPKPGLLPPSRPHAPGMPGPGGGGHGMMGTRIEKARDAQGTLRRLLGYLRPYRWHFLAVLLLAVASTTLALLGPFLMGRAIDGAIRGQDLAGLAQIALLMLGAYLGAWVARYGENLLMARASQRAMRTLRRDLF
ncbi:MAG: ABC transporter transmembrane domain-containing protein, partial [Candidatus Bipolaricaulota bacterium]